MAAIKEVLNKFKTVQGVDLAVVVDSSGAPLESFNRGNIDLEEVCLVASTGLQMTDALGGATGRGQTRQAILEYSGGTIILQPLAEETMLVIVTGDPGSLGKLRYLTRQYHSELVNAFQTAAN